MDGTELETPDPTTGRGPRVGSLVELVLAACDESEDVWEIGDRVDALVADDRLALSSLV
jgi:hypothetical protein